jgi:hypothetical protein
VVAALARLDIMARRRQKVAENGAKTKALARWIAATTLVGAEMEATEALHESNEEHKREKAVLAQQLHEANQRISMCNAENRRLHTTVEEQAVLVEHCKRALQESHELETTMRAAAGEWSAQFEVMREQIDSNKREHDSWEEERQR